MGGGKGAPSPPDYGPIAAASEKASERAFQLGEEQLQWAKDQYAQDRQITDKVVDSFLTTQNLNNEAAANDRARYEQEYQPLEDQLIEDAKSYATPERKDLEMGRAQAQVAQQFDAARNNAQRQLEDFGINPGATRYAALDIGLNAQRAAAEAGAGNQAAQMVDATGRALRSEAINVGRGYPGQIAGTYNTALQAGSGAVNSQLAQTASGANTMGTAPQYMGLGNQALNIWGNTLNNQFNNQMAAYKASQSSSSGLGSALGLIGSFIPMLADGGEVPPRNAVSALPVEGGQVPASASPSGGQVVDDVPARLSPGEFVLPKDVVQTLGTAQIHKIIMKARQDQQKLPQQSGAIPSARPTNQRQQALPIAA